LVLDVKHVVPAALAFALALSTIGGVGMWSVVVALPSVQQDFGVARGEASQVARAAVKLGTAIALVLVAVFVPLAFISGKTIYHFGSFGRNTIIGPSFNNNDFSIIKRTKVGENKTIEFRWEIFDLFNHANFGQPGRTAQVGSTTFGVITSTRFATGDSGSSRQMQFALKFKF